MFLGTPLLSMLMPAGIKRNSLILCAVLAATYLAYYIFIKPGRDVRKKFGGFGKVGYSKLNPGGQSRFKGGDFGFGHIDPNDPSHAGIPKLDFDPRAALSNTMLSDKFFFPGYNLTKRMMKHAWDGYKRFAWGHDELMPIGQKGTTSFGPYSIGLTMIDALDTLMLMNMQQEFLEARDYIFDNVNFDQEMVCSMFELNIRIVGGLLSAFALCGDGRFVSKAFDMANRFLSQFEHIFPDNAVNLLKRVTMSDAEIRATPMPDIGERLVSIAQAGTLSLEFGYLSHVLTDPIYKERAEGVIKALSQMETTIPGLFPTIIKPRDVKQDDDQYTLGGMADSFYEYLLKYWLFTNKKDTLHLEMYRKSVDAIKENLVVTRNKRKFLINKKGGTEIPLMEHLACFAPGMLALGAYHMGDDDTLQLAADLTETCYEMYHRQISGVSPEKCQVPSLEPVPGESHYLLRPEAIESIFVMWRITKDPKYRRWGYEIALNIEKHCKIPSGGYAGLADVQGPGNAFNDRQESFLMAESFKYLFLLFGPDEVLPLDKWVFNTEGHPLPIIK